MKTKPGKVQVVPGDSSPSDEYDHSTWKEKNK